MDAQGQEADALAAEQPGLDQGEDLIGQPRLAGGPGVRAGRVLGLGLDADERAVGHAAAPEAAATNRTKCLRLVVLMGPVTCLGSVAGQ